MLAGTALLFASCGSSSVNFGEYKVVYATDVSTYSKDKAKELSAAIKTAVGTAPENEGVRSTDEQTKGAGKEILIGNTNRPESADVLDSIDGYGYAIVVKGDKIVINGTTPLLTTMAVDHFITTYLSAPITEGEIEIEKKTVVSDLPMVELTTDFKIVYDNALDDTTNKTSGGGLPNIPAAENKQYNYDFPVYAAMILAKPIITSTTGLKLGIEDDTLKIPKEIIIGNTSDRDRNRHRHRSALSHQNQSPLADIRR